MDHQTAGRTGVPRPLAGGGARGIRMPNRCGLLLFAAVSLAAGCTEAPWTTLCNAECVLEIELPEDPTLPPRVPARARAQGGAILHLDIRGRRPAQAATVVAFSQAVLLDEFRRPAHSVELVTGRNNVCLRPWNDGVCGAPAGCRYVVINTGLTSRPPYIAGAGTFVIEPGSGSPHTGEECRHPVDISPISGLRQDIRGVGRPQ